MERLRINYTGKRWMSNTSWTICHLSLGMALLMLCACSMTKNVPEDDQLFVGLKKIKYENYKPSDHATETQEEVEATLATAPNGALFGSSYHRTFFAPGLWIWNAYSDKQSKFAKWMTSSFGKAPVLMSNVNPELRATVAQSVLRKHGYFQSSVDYNIVTMRNPKKAKIAYTVDMGPLLTIDSLEYRGFPAEADSMIRQTSDEALLHAGDPFDVTTLDAERSRLTSLFRNNGYYYYEDGYAGYLADTVAYPGKALLRLQLADGVPDAALHKWYIGRININMRKQMREEYTDSTVGRFFTMRYKGSLPPLRPRVIMADLRLRPRQEYSYDKYLESVSKLNALGLFSMIDFQFTPRDTTALCDTLDLTLNCTFDKPYDFYVETNANARTIGRVGPELRLGLARRNAFHGGEKIDVNVHGSYEWSTGHNNEMSNYEYGVDGQIEFPRIIAPFFGGNRVRRNSEGRVIRRRQFFTTPSTVVKMSANIIHRPKYYKMHVNSGELDYRWQTSASSSHDFSPLTFKYQYMNSKTVEFDSLVRKSAYLSDIMSDFCIPEMRYTYTYKSPANLRHPIRWETTLTEAGNFTSLALMALGRGGWNETGKKLFKNPYAQFLRLETDFTKTWTLAYESQLVAHFNGGIIYEYGNSASIPFNEYFYAGGANSIRAFGVRTVGPGGYYDMINRRDYSYVLQNGDLKLIFNLEYRRQLFGRLHGAVFLDAGNVWLVSKPEFSTENEMLFFNIFYGESVFEWSSFLKRMAVGTGIGLRYNLDFLVIRLDWGIGLHVPYTTEHGGFFNVDGFKKNQTLHFAIGYPF